MSRFVLDEDVDHDLMQDLGAMGQDAWSIQVGGLGSVTDGTVAVYAHQKGAAQSLPTTQSSRFGARSGARVSMSGFTAQTHRPRKTFAKHAVEILGALVRHQDVWMRVTPDTFNMTIQWN